MPYAILIALMTEQVDPHLSIEQISDLVVACLQEVLAEREQTDVVAGPTTRLVGPQSVLDSLGLVTLIVEVEDRLESSHAVSLTLADDRAMSQTRSPFLTVQSLSEYVGSRLADGG